MEMVADSVRKYALRIDGETGAIIGEYSQDPIDPCAEVDRLTKDYMKVHGMDPSDTANYVKAYEAVKADPANRELIRAYGS